MILGIRLSFRGSDCRGMWWSGFAFENIERESNPRARRCGRPLRHGAAATRSAYRASGRLSGDSRPALARGVARNTDPAAAPISNPTTPASLPATTDGTCGSISSSARAAATDTDNAVTAAGTRMLASARSGNPASRPVGSDEHHKRRACEAEVGRPDELRSKHDRADSDRRNREDQRVDDRPPARALAKAADATLGQLDVSALVI